MATATPPPTGGSTDASATYAKAVEQKGLAPGVVINAAAWTEQAERVLTPGAVSLIAGLHAALQEERQELLQARTVRQRRFDEGAVPEYLEGDAAERARGEWKVAPLPDDLLVRRVEITGPVSDAKMVINMLSRTAAGTRADAAMLDFEDSMKPSWPNVMQGVENLVGAAGGTLTFLKPAAGDQPEKLYALDADDMPLLMVRCRGLHLDESNLQVDGEPVSGGLMDLALSAFHTARVLLAQGKTPKYYVPKVEHYLEARWWNRLLTLLETELGLSIGTLRATFLIETLPAAFQMEEILYELRDHAAGLNVGRWDKIFSDIKVLKEHPNRVMADRGSISLNRPWMKNYAMRLIKICHRHGAFAMGGMAAFTPGSTQELREEQTRKVVEDKEFEFSLGHDGCWVSHPYFIGPALAAFPRENQLDIVPDIDDRPELLPESTPPKTIDGLRKNVRVGIGYQKGWNQDIGCVAWDDLMEDLATLEISRAQTWQWLRHQVQLEDGRRVTPELVGEVFRDELEKIEGEIRAAMQRRPEADVQAEIDRYAAAAADAEAVFTEEEFRPFLCMTSDLAGM
jgi:malate synthase